MREPDVGDRARYVPYRLLAPFYAVEMAGVADHAKNGELRRLADETFGTTRPHYRYAGRGKIELHPSTAPTLLRPARKSRRGYHHGCSHRGRAGSPRGGEWWTEPAGSEAKKTDRG